MSLEKKSTAIVVARRNASSYGKNVTLSLLIVIRIGVESEPFATSIWIISVVKAIKIIRDDLFKSYTILTFDLSISQIISSF